MDHTETIGNLNELIRIDIDSEAGFQNAAVNTRNSELETLFKGYAQQHAKFAGELQEEVKRLGGKAADSGTVGGSAHRGWMDLKSALSGHSASAVITSCESGADSAVAAYAGAVGLGVKIEGKTRTIIERHLQKLREMLTHLRRLAGEVEHGTVFPSNE